MSVTRAWIRPHVGTLPQLRPCRQSRLLLTTTAWEELRNILREGIEKEPLASRHLQQFRVFM